MQFDDYTKESKLDMIIALLRNGWSIVRAVPTPYKQYRRGVCPKLFMGGIRRPSSYYVCLLESEQLFARWGH